ncbi:MAG TPA: cellulose binding domain-containing protein [Streptosporangiaceae bacterium]|nr:cellulose binding domain-containing protein [Streptosporangiaceae bacterium]
MNSTRRPGRRRLSHALPPLARAAAGLTVAATVAALAASALPATAATSATTATTATAASVTVNATSGLGTIPQGAIGLNTAVYDGDMNDTAVPGLLKAAGIDAMRYPGGSYSDIFNWQTNTAAEGGFVAPNTTFANFMTTAQGVGAAPIVTVNYGTGTPALAAAWVANAKTNADNVKYWEVGNEVYGNGTYGANWEADSHCDTAAGGSPVTIGSEPSQTFDCGPAAYAKNFLAFQSAMQASDASAKVCAVLTTPGFWPDGVTNSQYPQSWNQTVLTALGSHTQCVIVHYYPGGSNAAGMLTDPQDIAGIVSSLHSQVSQYAGISSPASVPIIVTETNSTVDLDTQPGALFTADMYLTWLENGAANVDYWNEHNGEGTVSTVNGATDFGDQGMFSNNTNYGGTQEPAVDTPFAPYYAVEMISKLGAPGDEMVSSTSGNALLRVHAVRTAGGALNVLIDNEDPSNSYAVSLAYSGFTPNGSPTVYTFAANGTSITSASQSSTSSVTVSPYSLTVVHVPGSGGTGVTAPGAPGQPTVSGLSSSTSGNNTGTATLSWPASTAGTNPVAKYNVYQQGSGGTTTLAGTATGTSITLTGLTIGTTYTYNVIALDSQGNQSLPSPPVTFTVPPPANSSCAVHYVVNSSWPGGFNASITLTNKGTTAINGWTLTFTFPSGEAVQGGWDGTWTQSGQNVTVKDAGWNSGLAAGGGNTTIGFNGTDTGGTTPPAAFFINGTICANN